MFLCVIILQKHGLKVRGCLFSFPTLVLFICLILNLQKFANMKWVACPEIWKHSSADPDPLCLWPHTRRCTAAIIFTQRSSSPSHLHPHLLALRLLASGTALISLCSPLPICICNLFVLGGFAGLCSYQAPAFIGDGRRWVLFFNFLSACPPCQLESKLRDTCHMTVCVWS